MHSQMVEKIVPLGEDFSTSLVVAGEGTCHTSGLDSEISDMAELSGVWNISFIFKEGNI